MGPGLVGVNVISTGWSCGSGLFTPKSSITMSVAHVRSTFRVTTSVTACPTLTRVCEGMKPSAVTAIEMRVAEPSAGAASSGVAVPRLQLARVNEPANMPSATRESSGFMVNLCFSSNP